MLELKDHSALFRDLFELKMSKMFLEYRYYSSAASLKGRPDAGSAGAFSSADGASKIRA